MFDELIANMEYYINTEQDLSKKNTMRLMLNEYLTFKDIIKDLSNQIKQMEEAFNKGQVNPILMKEHQELQTKYNELEERMYKIYVLAK